MSSSARRDGVAADSGGVIFSVIVPVTRPIQVRRLLSGLARQAFDLRRVEVILVCDRDEKVSSDHPFKLKTLLSERNHPSVKRNIGAAAAQGAYFVFLDDDCCPPPNWLGQGLRLLEAHEVVSGPCGLDDAPLARRLSRAIANSLLGSGNHLGAYRKEEEIPFYDVGLYNVFMRRNVWEAAGGCNEEADYLMDDRELFYLLSLAGTRFINSPALRVEHDAPAFPWDYLAQVFKRRIQSAENVLVFHEMFRGQKVFYVVYASFFLAPLLLFALSWKAILALLMGYYLAIALVHLEYLKKDRKVYLCLPLGIMLSQITMLAGMLCGTLRALFVRRGFERAIIAKKKRIARMLAHA